MQDMQGPKALRFIFQYIIAVPARGKAHKDRKSRPNIPIWADIILRRAGGEQFLASVDK